MQAPSLSKLRPYRYALLIPSVAVAGVLAFGGPGLASSPQEMLKKAEAACLEGAAKDGWLADKAKVISSKALDADKVEVMLSLTKDGTSSAQLTCPYSVSQGVGKFGSNFSKSMATTVSAADEFKRGRIWWLLLPIGLAAVSWSVLRGQETAA